MSLLEWALIPRVHHYKGGLKRRFAETLLQRGAYISPRLWDLYGQDKWEKGRLLRKYQMNNRWAVLMIIRRYQMGGLVGNNCLTRLAGFSDGLIGHVLAHL